MLAATFNMLITLDDTEFVYLTKTSIKRKPI